MAEAMEVTQSHGAHAGVPLVQMQRVVVRVTHVVDPYKFYVQLSSQSETLKRLQANIDAYCNQLPQLAPAVGNVADNEYCFAFSPVQQLWCRARFVCFEATDRTVRSKPSRNSVVYSAEKVYYAQVFLIDYGLIDSVNHQNLRLKEDSLFNHRTWPPLAIKCALCNIKPYPEKTWSQDSIDFFRSFVQTRRMNMFVREEKGGFLGVELDVHDSQQVTVGRSSLAQILVFRDLARIRLGEKDEHQFTCNPILTFPEFPRLRVGDTNSVVVVHIESPDLFFVNLCSSQTEFIELQKSLNEYHDLPVEEYRLYVIKKNMPCVALFDVDYCFYRAVIWEVLSAEEVVVFYVDFGNKAQVNVTNIRVVKDKYLDLPKQAIPCKLHDLSPAFGFKWGVNVTERFKSLASGEIQEISVMMAMTVAHVDETGKAAVNLVRWHEQSEVNVNINASLVKEQLANFKESNVEGEPVGACTEMDRHRMKLFFRTKKCNISSYVILKDIQERHSVAASSKRESLIRVAVVNLESPEKFWVRLAEATILPFFAEFEARFNRNMNNPNAAVPVNMNPFNEGEMAAIPITDESNNVEWRRAKVLKRIKAENEGGDPRLRPNEVESIYQVFAVDYGKTLTAIRKDMRKFPPESEFLKDDPYALECTLFGYKPLGGTNWTRTSIDKFSACIEENCNEMFLLFNEPLPEEKQEPIRVTLVAKNTYIPGAIDPKVTKYIVVGKMLVEEGVAFRETTQDLNDYEDLNKTAPKVTTPRKERVDFKSGRDSLYCHLANVHKELEAVPGDINEVYADPEDPPSDHFQGIVTHIDAELNIYFQVVLPDTPMQPIQTINVAITEAIRERDSLLAFSGEFKKGKACSAYFDHGKTWDRAEIVGVVRDGPANSLLEVYFVDYGQVDQLFVEKLSRETFNLEIPKLALKAKLHNAQPFTEEVKPMLHNELRRILVDKTCQMTWENAYERPMKISVELPCGTNIKNMLLGLDLIKEVVDPIDIPLTVRRTLELIKESRFIPNSHSFTANLCYPVVISHVLDCNYVFLQAIMVDDITPDLEFTDEDSDIGERHDKFLWRQEKWRDEIKTCHLLRPPIREGSVCLAMYQDGLWYRAIIVKVIAGGKEVEVFFADYGNSEVVSFDKVKEIHQKDIVSPPLHAFLVKIDNIRPIKGTTWSLASKKLADFLNDLQCSLVVKFKNARHVPYTVDLFTADHKYAKNPKAHALLPLVERRDLEFIDPSLALVDRSKLNMNSDQVKRVRLQS